MEYESYTLRELLAPATTPPESRGAGAWCGYAFLATAIVFEVLGTLCLRFVASNEWWRLPSYMLYAAAFSLFPWVLKDVTLAVAYATWSAAGTAAVALISTVVIGDSLSSVQIGAIAGIVGSIIVLHLG